MKVVKVCSIFCARFVTIVFLGAATLGLGLLTFSYFTGDHNDRAEIEVSLKTVIQQPILAKLNP